MTYRVLLIAYAYPPHPPPGANRLAAMSSHLEALGHEVTVLTTSAFGSNGREPRETTRAPDALGLPGVRRLLLPTALTPGQLEAGAAPREGARGRARGLARRIAVPDIRAVTWLPTAAVAARGLLRHRRFDCLVTSAPPHSTHLVALQLGRGRPPWIADFRDGWAFEPDPPAFPTRWQETANRSLERAVVEGADGLVAATKRIAADLRARYGVGVRWVPNGWDPTLEPEVARATPPPVRSDRFTLVHTGSMSIAPGQDARALFAALDRIRRTDPETARRLELVLAGPLSSREARHLEEMRLGDLVGYVGVLPRASAVALQRRADALILVLGEAMSAATSKLAEYLAARRPIIVLGRASEAARIVTETRTGVVVDASDPVAIAGALRRAVEGALPGVEAARGLEDFRYPRPAEMLAAEIKRVARDASTT